MCGSCADSRRKKPALASYSRSQVLKVSAQIAVGLAFGAAILVVAASLMDVDRHELFAAIAAAPGWIAPVSVLALFILFCFGSLRWNGSMSGVLKNTFWQGYWAMLITYPFNSILPARGGDLVRVNMLSTRTGVSRVTILGGEIIDKGMDLCGPLPIIALLLIFAEVPVWVRSGAGLITGVLFLIVVFGFVMRNRVPSESHWLGKWVVKLRQAYVGQSVKRLLVTALVFAPMPWLGESLTLWILGNGCGIPLNPTQAFFVLVAVKVGMVVPTPGGIGSVEAAGATALVFFGAEPAIAFALMLIYRTSQLAAGSLVGAACLGAPVRMESNAVVAP